MVPLIYRWDLYQYETLIGNVFYDSFVVKAPMKEMGYNDIFWIHLIKRTSRHSMTMKSFWVHIFN